MVDVRQLLVQVVIAAMALGGVVCLCPAAVEAHGMPASADVHHDHRGASASEAANQTDCGHEDCDAACERASVVASKVSGATGGKPAFQIDYTGILPPDIPALAPAPGAVVSPNSSRLRMRLRQETPVHRCDRLLD